MREIIARNGLIGTLVTDNSTSFKSAEFQQFLAKNKILHLTSPPYHPPSNGPAENSCKQTKMLLKKNLEGSIKTRLSQALFHQRTKPHSITKIPPCLALNGRKYITLRDRINPQFVPSISKEKLEKSIKSFDVGENVLVLNSLPGPKWFRGVIMEKLGKNIYNVKVFDFDSIWCRHANQLRSTNAVEPADLLDIDVEIPQTNVSQAGNLPPSTVVAMPPPANCMLPVAGSNPVVTPADNLQVTNQQIARQSATENNGSETVVLRRSARTIHPPSRYSDCC